MSEIGVSLVRGTKEEIASTSIVDGQLLFTTDQVNNNVYADVGDKRVIIGGGGSEPDNTLSLTSTNTVQNKVVTTALNEQNKKINATNENLDSLNDTLTNINIYYDRYGELHFVDTNGIDNIIKHPVQYEVTFTGTDNNNHIAGYCRKYDKNGTINTLQFYYNDLSTYICDDKLIFYYDSISTSTGSLEVNLPCTVNGELKNVGDYLIKNIPFSSLSNYSFIVI